MAVTVTHATVTAVPDDPAYDIGSDEWNANHTVTNALDKTGDTMTGTLTSTLGTVVADTPNWIGTATWNNAGVTFTGIKYNVTSTASAAASMLLDLQVASSSVFYIKKSGDTRIGGVDVGGHLGVYGTGANTAVFQTGATADGSSIIATASGSVTGSVYTFDGVCQASADAIFRSYNQSTTTGSAIFNCLISATSSGDAYSSYAINGGTAWSAGLDNSDSDKFKIGPTGNLTATVGLSITTAGVVEVTTGIVTTPVTVATLPTGAKGMRSFVTDANATMTAGIGAVVAGGGANNVPVYYDGTNWRIG